MTGSTAKEGQRPPDGGKFRFTRDSVSRAECPPGKTQALYRDTDQPGLGLRVTANGARSFIFESRLAGKTIRVTIGPASMQIRTPRDRHGRPTGVGASGEAARLAALVAQGIDPRAEKEATIARQAAERDAARAERAKREVTGLSAWADYCDDRRSRWSALHLRDHLAMVEEGGRERQRSRQVVTKPGLLRSLLSRPLGEIDSEAVTAWLAKESRSRPTRAALGFRLLRAFIGWCSEQPVYRDIAQPDACAGRRLREAVPRSAARRDVLEREQLHAWFENVAPLTPVISAYLQVLLLTGARRDELLSLRWDDVDFAWGRLRLNDKVHEQRDIPLTRHVEALLRGLHALNQVAPEPPRRIRRDPEKVEAFKKAWKPSEWVFTSPRAVSGRLQEPRAAHQRALKQAGLPHLTLHGLRRSFGTLAEWVDCPVGVVAQIQGHKPSATAEKHYRVRPLDFLRLWHQRIEDWMLNEAGVIPAREQA